MLPVSNSLPFLGSIWKKRGRYIVKDCASNKCLWDWHAQRIICVILGMSQMPLIIPRTYFGLFMVALTPSWPSPKQTVLLQENTSLRLWAEVLRQRKVLRPSTKRLICFCATENEGRKLQMKICIKKKTSWVIPHPKLDTKNVIKDMGLVRWCARSSAKESWVCVKLKLTDGKWNRPKAISSRIGKNSRSLKG